MKSFREFVVESAPAFRVDNPGGEWLEYEQERAAKRKNMIGGSTTGWFKQNLRLPVEALANVPGYYDEHLIRRDISNPKYQRLEKDVEDPTNFDTKNNPIMIGVNHHGQPFVMEGNHRLGYALNNGISHIDAEVKYYNGGEAVEGPFHPSKVAAMHSE